MKSKLIRFRITKDSSGRRYYTRYVGKAKLTYVWMNGWKILQEKPK